VPGFEPGSGLAWFVQRPAKAKLLLRESVKATP